MTTIIYSAHHSFSTGTSLLSTKKLSLISTISARIMHHAAAADVWQQPDSSAPNRPHVRVLLLALPCGDGPPQANPRASELAPLHVAVDSGSGDTASPYQSVCALAQCHYHASVCDVPLKLPYNDGVKQARRRVSALDPRRCSCRAEVAPTHSDSSKKLYYLH